MTDSTTPLASLWRLRAVLALRGMTLSNLAHRVGCTPSHLRVVVLGRRGVSPALRTKLERELRPDEWNFARGETDVLRDARGDASPYPDLTVPGGVGDALLTSLLAADVTRGDLSGDMTSPGRVLHPNLEDDASDLEEITAGPADAPAPTTLAAPGRRSPLLPSSAPIRTTVALGPRPIVLGAAEATHEPPARRTR
jgi:transcriptional regulator with XRE-family HTH domain